MNKTSTQDRELQSSSSLTLGFMPPLYDRLCCTGTPLMLLFAFSLAEYFLPMWMWFVRGLGFVLFAALLLRYYRQHGITSVSQLVGNRMAVVALLYSVVFTLAVYVFFVYIATPIVIEFAETNSSVTL